MATISVADESEELVARIAAQILGPHSASARAVAELDARRANGESVCVRQHGNSWLVLPTPPAAGDAGQRGEG